jgi:hypothetical protein
MKNPGLLIVFLFFIILPCPVIAFQCLSENDCPDCNIDGAAVTKKSLNSGYTDKQILTCEYSSSDENVGKVTLAITCLENAGIARQWTDYYAGKGENPDKSQNAGLYSRSRWRCVSGGSSKGSGQSMITTFGCLDFTGTGRFTATIDADGQAGYLSSDPAAEESRKLDAAQDVVKARIQKYKDCFAGFSPGAAPSPQEKLLHGTIIATNLPYGTPQPLKYAEVDLMIDGKPEQITRTDASGKYNFSALLEKGKEYRLTVSLVYGTPDRYYFEIRNAKGEKVTSPDQGTPVEFSRIFTYNGDSDLVQDIDLDKLWIEEGQPGTNPFGIMYVHVTEALEFYKDVMKEDIHHHLPVTVFMFTDDTSAYHTRDSGTIGIGQGFSQVFTVQAIDSQRHVVYHEFSHYMMENMYGKMPDRVSDTRTTEINHGGYPNPGTGDSWGEGFAAFMPAVISDYYGHNQCGIYNQRNNLDADNTMAWGMWNAEEYAVAETLWDLYDNPDQMKACDYRMRAELQKLSGSPLADPSMRSFYGQVIGRSQTRENTTGYHDDDSAGIPLTGLWSLMRSYHPDFTSVYTALVTKYPQQKTGIDNVFANHGFSRNTVEGNKEYNFGEPFRDSNGNRVHDDGEYFIDLPRPWILRGTDIIGPAANYQRPQRRSSMEVPGNYIRVNNAVPFYTYFVEYPGTDYLPYVSTVQNIDGSVYIQVPQNPDAKFTVNGHGVTTGNTLIFTAKEFNEQYENSLKQGYYVSHDFQIRGPVPTTAPLPDFGQGGMGGPGTGASGILAQFLSPASRAPLFVSVPIAIGALLVLAVVLRKVV